MSDTFFQKSEELKRKFTSFHSQEARYAALIELGKSLPIYPKELKTKDKIVSGCQSTLYLHAFLEDEKIFFQACSEALISAGLAAILLHVYNGESPQTLLTCPPKFLADLGIIGALSPARSNGLAHIHLRMKQLSLKMITELV